MKRRERCSEAPSILKRLFLSSMTGQPSGLGLEGLHELMSRDYPMARCSNIVMGRKEWELY